jgi:hypothetical protein
MSQTFTQILYRLLSYPEYVEPLRREIHAAVAEEGWTTAGMDRMHKLDSFVRETQRIDTMGLGSSASLHSGAVTNTFFRSGYGSSRTTPIHIFQRGDHPGRYTNSCSFQCYSYG